VCSEALQADSLPDTQLIVIQARDAIKLEEERHSAICATNDSIADATDRPPCTVIASRANAGLGMP